ncbi:MAG: AAA family ATPase [Synergistaceae bacterium]|nr:AAA family ATPase [Synergistaceae bacterium]
MNESVEFYLIETKALTEEEISYYAEKAGVIYGCSRYNRELLMPYYGAEAKDKSCFVCIKQEDDDDTDEHTINNTVQELKAFFGRDAVVTKADYLSFQDDPQIRNAQRTLSFPTPRGRRRFRWHKKTVDDVLAKVNALTGFEEFKSGLERLRIYIENTKSWKKRPKYNVVIVDDTKGDVTPFVDAVYDLYLSSGVILAPEFISGCLEEASGTVVDSAFFYSIVENWGCGAFGRFRSRTPQSSQLREISKRSSVYITSTSAESYEFLKDDSDFASFFPFALYVKEPAAKEKLAYLQKEAAEFGFSVQAAENAEKVLASYPITKIKTAVSLAAYKRLSEIPSGNTLSFDEIIKLKPNACQGAGNDRKSAQEELDELVGLDSVKKRVREIIAFAKARGTDALPTLHMVFKGNPGTGKSTAARIIGRIFAESGLLKDEGKFIEADRNKLVSVYLGGTAERTHSVVEEALGGILFIDEAYSLYAGDRRDYGSEAIATLVKMMEDHRKEFVCILAGYTKEMDSMLNMNPGLRGRVQFYLDFEDYNAREMTQIFEKMCSENSYVIEERARARLNNEFEKIYKNRNSNFANGRTVRNIFERVKMKQALRISDSDIIAERDIADALEERDIVRQLFEADRKQAIGF